MEIRYMEPMGLTGGGYFVSDAEGYPLLPLTFNSEEEASEAYNKYYNDV